MESKINKKVIIPIVIILILLPLGYLLVRLFLLPKPHPLLPTILPPRIVDLTAGRLVNLESSSSAIPSASSSAMYVEQDPKICNQTHLNDYLGFTPPAYPYPKLKSYYGKKNVSSL